MHTGWRQNEDSDARESDEEQGKNERRRVDTVVAVGKTPSSRRTSSLAMLRRDWIFNEMSLRVAC